MGILADVGLIGAAVLILFVAARRVLALAEYKVSYQRLTTVYRETVALNHELQATRDELRADNRALSEANASLRTLATTDPSTDLPNTQAVATALDHELERAHRYSRPCAVLLIDLDSVAAPGGRGQSVDDHALREVAALMRSSLRGVDTLGRWSDEQFVALLPETDPSEALAAAEHLRASVAAHLVAGPREIHVTCSIGVAAYPHDGVDRAALVDAAGRAVSLAKRLGRNQARAAGEPAVAALESEGSSREAASLAGTVEALAALVEARDCYTGRHAQEMAALTARLALASGCDAAQARLISLAGRLHDVGKVAVPDATLRKQGRLSDDDWASMRTHPGVGADIVGRVPALRALAPLIGAHHERWDGTGYPYGVAGTAILLGARIIAVADAYGAMTAGRPYREALSPARALRELQRCAGTQFDPVVVATLERVLVADPTLTGGAGVA